MSIACDLQMRGASLPYWLVPLGVLLGVLLGLMLSAILERVL